MMVPRGVILIAWILALSTTSTAVPFLMDGVDPFRSGASLDPGPTSDGVASYHQLPGARETWAPPLILDGGVFVSIMPETGAEPGVGAIWRIDLATGEERMFVNLSSYGHQQIGPLWSDGNRLFHMFDNGLAAYDLDGVLLWHEAAPEPDETEADWTWCTEGTVIGSDIFTQCQAVYDETVSTGRPEAPGALGQRITVGMVPFVVRWDAATGANELVWEADASQRLCSLLPTGVSVPEGSTGLASRGIIGTDELVVFGVVTGGPWGHGDPCDSSNSRVVETAFDLTVVAVARDGVPQWTWSVMEYGTWEDRILEARDPAYDPVSFTNRNRLASDGEHVFVLGESLYFLDLDDGTLLGRVPVIDEGTTVFSGLALAVADGSAYATAGAAAVKVDVATRQTYWSQRLSPGFDFFGTTGFIVAGGRAYASHFEDTISAFAAEDGAVERSWRLPHTGNLRYGIGEGTLAVAAGDGQVWIIGETGAAILPAWSIGPMRPQAGEHVTLDLASTRPGAQADDLEYRIEWGDGAASPWQGASTFDHAYDEDGEYAILIQARNSAGQSAERTATIVIGEDSQTFLERAFSAEHQEQTFFILGLIITAIAGAFGVWRVGRRRRLLRREIRAAEEAAQRHSDRPALLEKRLAEIKQRAHGHLLAGNLDEPQFAVLRDRIDDLARSSRLVAVHHDLGFLPVRIADVLNEMLADGRIDGWERDHLVALVEEDASMTPDYKAKVRQQVDEWAERDRSAGPTD